MKNSTPRQRYLYLVSRLYELAAEFTDTELQLILKSPMRVEDEVGISMVVRGLMQLHETPEITRDVALPRVRVQRLRKLPENVPPTFSSVRMSAEDLEMLLNDEVLFPRIQDLARAFPNNMQPHSKEGRGRYVKRLIKSIKGGDKQGAAHLERALANVLNGKPSTFLSQWKNLIRDL